MKNLLQLFLLLLFISSISFAQKKSVFIQTERPGFTNSATALFLGDVQIESGIRYGIDKFDNLNPSIEISNISFLGSLVRYGVSDFLELRFGGEYLFQTITAGESVINNKGLSSLMAGAKFQFLTTEKTFLNAALLLELGLPFGSADFKPEKIEPKFIAAVGHDLVGPFDIAYNLGTVLKSNNNRYDNLYGVKLGCKLDERFKVFVENYGNFSKSVNPKFFVDGGLTYLHKFNLQVDLYFGKEITPSTNAWFIGAGFGMRFPD